MSSASPADPQIFFKNMQNKLKGPYTERRVQEYYEQEWFDGSTQFCFMSGDERPNEKTEFLTLDTLCSLYGIGCPFISTLSALNDEKKEEKLVGLEKELADLSIRCDVVKKLKQRNDNQAYTLKVKDHSTQRDHFEGSFDAAFEWSNDKLKEWWAAVRKMLINQFVHACECFECHEFPTISASEMRLFERCILDLDPEMREILFIDMTEFVEKKTHLFCSFCDRFMFTARQTFMHIGSPEHIAKVGSAHVVHAPLMPLLIKMIGEQRIDRMFEQEAENVRSQKKFSHWMEENVILPVDFGEINVERYRRVPIKFVAAGVVESLQADHEYGKELMRMLAHHIGDGKTRCIDCALMFDKTAEYYDHLLTYYHLSRVETFDSITLVVNVQKRELAHRVPWPFTSNIPHTVHR